MTGIRDELIEAFGKDGMHWSCLGQNGEMKLNALIREAFPDQWKMAVANDPVLKFVEIGTHRGVSSTILAEYGSVLTFDIKDWELREKVWNRFRVRDRIKAEIVSGDAEIAERLKDEYFDLAFIDGCHEYASVAANFEAVKKCGRVIFHDYEPKLHGERTVRFVDNLRDGRTTKLIPFALWERWEI